MRLLTNTNIMIDDFDYCKNFPKFTFIHFLTHFHADHWYGMTPNWDYGLIYCSEATKILILNKFPKLESLINTNEILIPFEIKLNNNEELKIKVTFFDAHHIPGSIMILFDGFMGTILHTGDFRFCDEMIMENKILYPEYLLNSELSKCSIHIDELIIDNTYCDPMFDFPRADSAFEIMSEIIDKNPNKRILIVMGALGKEEICEKLAKKYQTLIVISEQKFQNITALKLRTELFTINKNDGWIELISKKHRVKRLEEEKLNNN